MEGLNRKFRYKARLSFSTNVTAYLKSGKCIFAIGDKDIAPIDYFEQYDAAVTETDYEQIAEKIADRYLMFIFEEYKPFINVS